MKQIIFFILAIALFSCKKEEPKPIKAINLALTAGNQSGYIGANSTTCKVNVYLNDVSKLSMSFGTASYNNGKINGVSGDKIKVILTRDFKSNKGITITDNGKTLVSGKSAFEIGSYELTTVIP
jgi:hypothetical protein